MTTIISYLQSPIALPFAVAFLVAIVRRFWGKIDGPVLVCLSAVVAGALLAVAQQYLVPGTVQLPWYGVLAEGAVAGFVAFGGHDLLRGLLSKASNQTNVDLRGTVGGAASVSTVDTAISSPTTPTVDVLVAPTSAPEPTPVTVPDYVVEKGTVEDPEAKVNP